jgi:hypothetical protein
MEGMVNIRELLVNVVIQDKPKVLRGLSQKGTGAGTGFHPYPVMDHPTLPADREHLTPSSQPWGTW